MKHTYRKGDLVSVKARVMFDQNILGESPEVFLDLGYNGVSVLTEQVELISQHLEIGDKVVIPGILDVAYVKGIASEHAWVEYPEGLFSTYLAKDLRRAPSESLAPDVRDQSTQAA